MNFTDDIPKYRKKSQKTPPKKTKHKHVYEPCIIEMPHDFWRKPHERDGVMRPCFYNYCTVCGKIGDMNPDKERWWTTTKHFHGSMPFLETVPTPEGAKELDPITRTLPTFRVDDIFPKFVDLED